MNESVLSGIISAAQFSVGAVISAVGILALAGTFIAVNRLFHMFWIPTNLAQKIVGFINENGAAVKKPEPDATKRTKKPTSATLLGKEKP